MKLLCDPLIIADLQLPDTLRSQTRQKKASPCKRKDKKRKETRHPIECGASYSCRLEEEQVFKK
jgi:hypothetical protein